MVIKTGKDSNGQTSSNGGHDYKDREGFYQRCLKIRPLLQPALRDDGRIRIALCSFGLGREFGEFGLHPMNHKGKKKRAPIYGMRTSKNPVKGEWGASDAIKYKNFFLSTIKNAAESNKKSVSTGGYGIVVCNEYSFPSFFGEIPSNCDVVSIKQELQGIATKNNCVIFSGTANICVEVPIDPDDDGGGDMGHHVGYLFYPKRNPERYGFAAMKEEFLNHHYKVYKHNSAKKGPKELEGFTSPGEEQVYVFVLNRLTFGVSICADFLNIDRLSRSEMDYLNFFNSMEFESDFNDVSPGILFVPAKDQTRVRRRAQELSAFRYHHICVINSLDESNSIDEAIAVFNESSLINDLKEHFRIYSASRSGSLSNKTSFFQKIADKTNQTLWTQSLAALKSGTFLSTIAHYNLDISMHHDKRFQAAAKKYIECNAVYPSEDVAD